MNPMNAKPVTVTLDKERTFVFSWKAIDYITDRYESLGEALLLMSAINGDAMTITKKTMNALFDIFTALLISDDPEITVDKVKELIPFHKIGDFAPMITKAIEAGSVENP